SAPYWRRSCRPYAPSQWAARSPSPPAGGARAGRARARGEAASRVSSSAQPLDEMVADAQGVGDDGERRIDRRARREEAGVDRVEVVHLVRAAVDVEHGARWISAEA